MARIMLVEDDRRDGTQCRRALADEGHEVSLVTEGREALRLLADGTDLVVLSLQMRGMDGLDLLGRIVSRDNLLPVIIHSAYPNYMNNFMTWAADDFVLKSPDFRELKSAVQGALDGQTARTSR